MSAYLNAIATAAPAHDIHQAFLDWASPHLPERERKVFLRMVERSGLGHRWSVLPPPPGGKSAADRGGFYGGAMPPTSARMKLYGEAAPALALEAIAGLEFDEAAITHVIVASCTGFVAPGVDQIIAKRLGLDPSVERLLIGFMGCYAAVTALRTARHIVRSEPHARVLVVTVELCSLHLHPMDQIEPLLAGLLFGDGAAAALVTSDPDGLALNAGFSVTLPDSDELITWSIADRGFEMTLSGAVPGRIAAALGDEATRQALSGGRHPHDIAHWAVHAGGRTILDAVETGLSLHQGALADSRTVLYDYGNMSSATLMFVLQRLLARGASGPGVALAFGPGVAAEGFAFAPA